MVQLTLPSVSWDRFSTMLYRVGHGYISGTYLMVDSEVIAFMERLGLLLKKVFPRLTTLLDPALRL